MNRIGFHYFQDTQHYRQSDLDTWLPELRTTGVSWLVLKAPPDRAIPERFLLGLLEAGIKPVLHFDFPPDNTPAKEDLTLLFQVYAKWGVEYITLFNKPNLQTGWQTTNWAQTDLVERFLDIYLPLAKICVNAGLTPIYPPLEPGGDYWDIAFLKSSLRGIKRRGYKYLLDKLVIGAVARTRGNPLNWGAGGPERWPKARPYFTPENEEDQRGFRIFDWYNTFVQSILVAPKPIFLFEVGGPGDDDPEHKNHTLLNKTILHLLDGESIPGIDPIPENVIGAAFWLLSGPAEDQNAAHVWYTTPSEYKPIVELLHNRAKVSNNGSKEAKTTFHSISHYLLLPTYAGEISDVHLDLIRPFVKKYQPTIGFSIQEACQAERVTVIGGNGTYPQNEINELRNAGCIVHQIEGHGIDIASFMAS
jgi:hypothetical protein